MRGICKTFRYILLGKGKKLLESHKQIRSTIIKGTRRYEKITSKSLYRCFACDGLVRAEDYNFKTKTCLECETKAELEVLSYLRCVNGKNG